MVSPTRAIKTLERKIEREGGVIMRKGREGGGRERRGGCREKESHESLGSRVAVEHDSPNSASDGG